MKGRIISFLLIMSCILGASGASPEFAVPDFAYPQEVIKNARKNLDAGRDPLRCLLEITVAERSIDPDTIFTLPALVEDYIAKAGTDADKAMLTAFEAEIYTSIYKDSRWKYNNVDAPLMPLPEEISKWSAEQFAYKLNDLYDKALALAEKDNRPVGDFKNSLEYGKESTEYIPDIYGFILNRKVYNFNNFRNTSVSNTEALSADCKKMASRYAAGSDRAVYWACTGISLGTMRNASREYLDLYKKNEGLPGAPYALVKALESGMSTYEPEADDTDYERSRDIAQRDSMIDLLRRAIAKYPGFYQKTAFENHLNKLTEPTISYSVPDMAAPRTSIEATMRYSFAKSVGFALYKLPTEDTRLSASRISSTLPCLDKKSATATETDGKAAFSFRLSEPGRYALIPIINGAVQKNADAAIISCTPFIPVNINGCTTNAVITADYTTGAPVQGVVVDYMKAAQGNRYTKSNLGKTGRTGTLSYTAPTSNRYWGSYLRFTYKNHVYNFDQDIRANAYTAPHDEGTDYNVNVLTDRNLYHPGDSISWVVAMAEKRPGQKAGVAAGQKLKIRLQNTNYQNVDTVDVTTDGLGRASGTFATTKGSLTGNYRIIVQDEQGVATYGSSWVMVSDFKLPTFEAEFTSVERDVPAPGAVRLSGKARTYSGMPVAGAKVSVKVVGANRWRWFMPTGEELVTLEAVTDASGVFSVDVPASDLAKTNASGGKFDSFQASAVITSITAETSECTKNFTTGKPYVLAAGVAQNTADSSSPLAVSFSAYNADGDNKPIAIGWQLLQADKTVLSGNAKGGERQNIDVSSLAAGRYTLRLVPTDAALADTVSEAADIILYNEKRNQVPGGYPLFVPVGDYTVKGNKAEILVGTSEREIYVYYAMQLGNDLVTFEPHVLKHGFERIGIQLPEDRKDARVYIFTVYQGRVEQSSVHVTRPTEKAPEIIAESFRDRLTPGSPETWRFRLVDGKGKGIADAAVVATMYNKALDQLRDGSFAALFHFYESHAYMSLGYKNREIENGSGNIAIRWKEVPEYIWPEYMFWNSSTVQNLMFVRGTGARKMRTAASMAFKGEIVEAEESVANDKFAMADQTDTGGAILEEEVAEAKPEEAGGAEEEKFEYRPSEVLQAFWRPSLVSDAEGNVDIVFTVPNANTTWQFKASAWDKELRTALFEAEALANKPVMVQPNLPRFMRQGDKASVLANVYNNSTDTVTVVTTVELFDVNTDKVRESARFENVIAPEASAVVSMPVTAPVDGDAIGYRVRSVAGSFADGEQTVIPVLSSATTVVESTEFYLNPNDKDPFTLTVKASDDAAVTLQYCQNPVWTVVKAMRGIAGRNETTANGLVSRLFSALSARYIVEHNPAIASAIKHWSENPDEEALVSMLEKNEDLKRLMLDQTPWVQAAASNTRRMAALADLLDPEKAASAVRETVAALNKLQNADGGFRWGGWSDRSSEWATRVVLMTLGLANSLNMLPAGDMDIAGMIQPAFSYIEREAVKPQRAKTDSELALIATLLPTVKKSTAGDRLIRDTVAETARNWRKDGTVGKAYDVLILAGNGRKTEAGNVLASIREFGVVKAGMGLCFPSVSDIRSYATIIQAYATMGAPSTDIDAMRQWVIVQAQANDDLGAYNPDYIIASVLMTGSDWTSVAVANNVTVNGKQLEISKEESATGYFAQRLADKGKLKIVVTPNGVTPSYGSVLTVDRRPMSSVKARPGRDLAIDKRVLVERDGQWVETKDFALGERVRVQLTIVAKRDLEYISIDDERPACFEPVEQLPGYVYDGGLGFYRENLDASTRLFVGYLPKGTYHVTYDMTANVAGEFISGIATLQSQYAPELTAHSAAARITVE